MEQISDNLIGLVCIIMVFGLPVFIIIPVLLFKYLNRRAKYRLASQAIAAGKEIPKDLFNSNQSELGYNNRTLSKGIKNICLGIGLGVFLWFLTHEMEIAAIGFLIFCMGVGQVIIARVTRPSNRQENNLPEEEKE